MAGCTDTIMRNNKFLTQDTKTSGLQKHNTKDIVLLVSDKIGQDVNQESDK